MEQLRISPPTPHDEIDLFDLMRSIWEQKVVLVITAAVVTLLAAVYAFTATPHYQVQSMLRPAQLKDLDAFNIPELYTLTPEDALRQLGATLESYDARLSFFRANPELFEKIRTPGRTLEQSFERFNADAFQILQPTSNRDKQSLTDFIGIQLTYPKGLDGVAIVNGLVEHAEHLQRAAISRDIEVLIQNRLDQLELRIAAARAAYEARKDFEIAQLREADALKRAQLEDELAALRTQLNSLRQDRIAQLDEAIKIAKSLGITKPTTPSALSGAAHSGQGSIILTEVNNRQIPLYFMGTETLEAERAALQQRTSDDFVEPRISEIAKELQLLEQNRKIEVLMQREQEDLFLTEIADWREEESRLRSLRFDMSEVDLAQTDRPAVAPVNPIKPKKSLVLALGMVLGGMLGIFVALIRSMIQKQAQASKEHDRVYSAERDPAAA